MRTTRFFVTLPAALPATVLVTLLVTLLAAALPHHASAAGRTAAMSRGHAAERQPTSEDLNDFVGQYTLSDGRTLSVTQRRRQLVAAIDGQAPAMLVPVRAAGGVARADVADVAAHPNVTSIAVVYAAPGAGWQLAFDRRRNGNVAGVVLEKADGLLAAGFHATSP